MIALTTDVLAEINGLSPAADFGARDFPFDHLGGAAFHANSQAWAVYPVRPRTVSPRLPQAVTTLAHTPR